MCNLLFSKMRCWGVYGICNCCSCCCGAMQSQRNGIKMLALSGYSASVNEELCRGCGRCEQIYPFSAIELSDGIARIDDEVCMGCGVCVNECSFHPLTLNRTEDRGTPLDIDELMVHRHASMTGLAPDG